MPVKPRSPSRLYRVTVTARPVTCKVSPADIERYLVARGYRPEYKKRRGWPASVPTNYRRRAQEYIPSPRDTYSTLARVIEAIALHEGCFPGDVLREVAAMAQMAEDGG
ncbi:hypothetical protein [Sorangium sp. So ce131]|uniref:hypothetical protein n=1 Tax=Sorangium sp. So ce131 TaxID=3133282 RepID=UPI003F5DFFC4